MTSEIRPRSQLARVVAGALAAAALLAAPAVAWDVSSSSPHATGGAAATGSPLLRSLRRAAREIASGVAEEYASPAAPAAATTAAPAAATTSPPVAGAAPTGGVVITATKGIFIGPGVTVGGSGLSLRCK